MDDLEDYFWKKPTEIRTFYNVRFLGYITVTCFVIGLISYIFMIRVFTRKHMISPINTILIHYLANLIMCAVVYLPRTYHELFRATLCAIPEHNTYTWEKISLHSFILAATFRHFAIWMALMIGIWRYIAVVHPLKEQQYCNMEITKKIICFGYALIFFGTSIPLYNNTDAGPAIKSVDEKGCLTANFTTAKNVTIYEFQIPLENYPFWYDVIFVALSILKLVPSCILGIISVLLIKTLCDARKRRREMVAISGRKNTNNSRMKRQTRQQTDRITILLMVMLALLVAGEVPHGIYCTLTLFYGPKFFWKYFYPAMETLNALTYVSEFFNFAIYYSMSREFRETFKSLFKRDSNRSRFITPQTSSSSLHNVKY